jgi:hypothetical protein
MLSGIIQLSSKAQQSYDAVFFNIIRLPIEWLAFMLALITAFFAVRSFRAVQRQNELATVPHIFFEGQGTPTEQSLVLVNDNGRLAYDFKIDPIEILNKSEHGKDWVITIYTFGFKYEHANRNFTSKPNEKIPVTQYSDGQKMSGADEHFGSWLITSRFEFKRGLWLTFRDSQNLRFFALLRFKADGIVYIARASTRFTLRWRIYKFVLDISQSFRKIWWRLRIAYFRLLT